MTKILTRFYLEDGAWAKLQYVAALMHKAPKDVAELIMRRALAEQDMGRVADYLMVFEMAQPLKPKKGRKP
jgi:hypothetical protein